VILALVCFGIAGWSGLVVGFVWSTVLLFHATFCINSLAHVHGRKRYVTGDDSRNNWWLAFFTMGRRLAQQPSRLSEQAFARAFGGGRIDLSFYVLKALSFAGLVWDLKTPPVEVLRNEQRLGSRVVNRAAEQLAARL